MQPKADPQSVDNGTSLNKILHIRFHKYFCPKMKLDSAFQHTQPPQSPHPEQSPPQSPPPPIPELLQSLQQPSMQVLMPSQNPSQGIQGWLDRMPPQQSPKNLVTAFHEVWSHAQDMVNVYANVLN